LRRAAVEIDSSGTARKRAAAAKISANVYRAGTGGGESRITRGAGKVNAAGSGDGAATHSH